MSNFKELKDVILGAATRSSSSFQSGSVNFVDIAINNAIIFAQRKYDFEWNKGEVSIECDLKGNINDAVDVNGKPVKIKRIIKAYGQTEPEDYDDVSVPYLSKVSQIADNTKARNNFSPISPDCPRVIHQGQIVYLAPKPLEKYTLYFEAVKWLPRLCKDTDTNFLLEYAFDFLMYRSIVELNFFLKEDDRFNVTKTMLEDSWACLISWDSSLISPTETEIEL